MPQNIEQLVEREVLKWHRLRQAAEASARADEVSRRRVPTAAVAQRPMVAISREAGSGGWPLGVTIAARLGIECYGRELVERIAQSARVRQDLVESVDERTQSAIENWIGRQIGHAFMAESDYLRNLSKVLLIMSRHASAVIVGRGAAWILDPALTLRLRLIAPLERRIESVARRDQVDAQSARARLLHVEAERAAFVRRHFDVDVASPGAYDLVLNCARLTIETCAELAVHAFRARFGAPVAPILGEPPG